MGFLDRMITDMIGEATGVRPKRLVKMVGGKNLLMMAGAAMAGGMMSQRSADAGQGMAPPAAGGQGMPPAPPIPPAQGAPHQPNTPPPPPNLPNAAPPPPPIPQAAPAMPPPPAPTAGPEAAAPESIDDLPNELTYAMVRTLVAAALSDGHLAEEEKSAIQKHLESSGLSDDQIAQIRRDLVLPPTTAELAAMAPTPEAREVLFRSAAVILLADGQVNQLERDWLGRLAGHLGIPDGKRQEVERELLP